MLMTHQNAQPKKTHHSSSTVQHKQYQYQLTQQFLPKINKNKNTTKTNKQTTQVIQNINTSRLTSTKNYSYTQPQLKSNQKCQDLDRRSTLQDIQKFIDDLQKSQQIPSTTTKFLLSGYIDIIIKQSNPIYEIKDNSVLTIDRLRVQWLKISEVWKLYKKKVSMCIGEKNVHELNRLKINFDSLDLEMQKIQKNKQRLELTRKSIRKFYSDLIN